jgi:hypothetical protein
MQYDRVEGGKGKERKERKERRVEVHCRSLEG